MKYTFFRHFHYLSGNGERRLSFMHFWVFPTSAINHFHGGNLDLICLICNKWRWVSYSNKHLVQRLKWMPAKCIQLLRKHTFPFYLAGKSENRGRRQLQYFPNFQRQLSVCKWCIRETDRFSLFLHIITENVSVFPVVFSSPKHFHDSARKKRLHVNVTMCQK